MIKTKTFCGQPISLNPPLTEMTWTFGCVGEAPLTNTLVLAPNGKIKGYSHSNETSWRIENHKLLLMKENGELMWRSRNVIKDSNGLLNITLETLEDSQTHFILQQNPTTSVAETSAPDETPPKVQETAPQATPSGIPDAKYLFPADLEVSPTPIKKVLLVGSSLAALYLEQFQQRYPDTAFDYIPYEFVSILPPTPRAPINEYDFYYIQIPLRSVLTDRIIWGFRFNEAGFANTILQDAFTLIDTMLDAAMLYNKQHGLLAFVSNFIVPQMSSASSVHKRGSTNDIATIVYHLNEYLSKKVSEYNNAYLMNIDAISSTIGKRFLLDDMIYFYSHVAVAYQDWDDFGSIARNEPIPALEQFYPIKRDAFIDAVFRQALTTYRSVKQIDQVKAVVFDLDNTLWRGQIAEHYRPEARPWPRTDGWPLGIWETIHHLRARGILVAVCSNNDYNYVKERWDDVIDPSFLSLEDFAAVKINEMPKAQNISEICKEFNIKPKSVVFVDDNPEERAAVIAAFPEIRTIGGNPYLTRRILLWSAETQIAHLTEDAEKREEMTRSQIEREETHNSMDRDTFLSSLNCEVSFLPISNTDQAEFRYVLELTNQTNQFNTTGKRWSFEEVRDFLKSGGQLLSFRVKDKFTDYGLVGILYIKDAEIIQFVMSSRVLGMEIEEFAVTEAVQILRSACTNSLAITAQIKETPDNTPCRNVYFNAGFREIFPVDGVKKFILDDDEVPLIPLHIKKIVN